MVAFGNSREQARFNAEKAATSAVFHARLVSAPQNFARKVRIVKAAMTWVGMDKLTNNRIITLPMPRCEWIFCFYPYPAQD
jgi:hypothetical protein